MMLKIFFLTTCFLFSNIFLFSETKSGKLTLGIISPKPENGIQIEKDLKEKSFIQIVERNNINEILQEMKLGQMGVLKEGTYAKAGSLIGADYLLLVDRFATSIRLIHSASSKILGSWSQLSQKNINSIGKILEKENSIRELLHSSDGKSKDYEIRIHKFPSLPSDKTIKLGDEITFSLEVISKTEKKVHLTIFVYRSDGTMIQIFPNQFQPKNQIDTNSNFSFPNKNIPDKYKIIASEPTGEDQYIFIASKDKLKLGVENYEGYQTFDEEMLLQSKGVKLQLDKQKNYSLKKMKLTILD
jgi:hypothetical protein